MSEPLFTTVLMPVTATLLEDKAEPGVFRVEAILEDGAVEVALFSGENALDRAIAFAGGGYYAGWADPEGWAKDSDVVNITDEVRS